MVADPETAAVALQRQQAVLQHLAVHVFEDRQQYAAFEPVKGYHVNGELTLGENVADNSGMAIAYRAYQLSLAGKPAPVIDGLSGDQRQGQGSGAKTQAALASRKV